MGTEYILELKHISKSFPGVKALDDVTLCVRPGTVHSLMGENGAGKSTLMKCLFGIYSFDEGEMGYKYMKSLLEGGSEGKPDNVLFYATSNRRHLIKESFDDVKDYKPELHSSDTVQEKLSLVARFGVTIYYGAPEKQEYDDIVINLAKKNGIEMDTDELLLEAGRWELNHGGRSGRCAQQFIIYLLGQKALKKQ